MAGPGVLPRAIGAFHTFTKDTVLFLNQELRLPATGREQDWDLELADPDRVGEFLDYLETHALDDDSRYALMALILASLDDLACLMEIAQAVSDRVLRLLRAEPKLYDDLVSRWRSEKDDPDAFPISPLLHMI